MNFTKSLRGSRKERFSTSGPTTKRGGVKAGPLRKITFFKDLKTKKKP